MAVEMSYSEQLANYRRLSLEYMTKLRKRLANGEISQTRYDAELAYIQRSAPENPRKEFWTAFANEIEASWQKLPGTIGNAAGSLVGKTIGGLGSGLFRGVGFYGFALLAVLAVFWAFTKGPMSNYKVK